LCSRGFVERGRKGELFARLLLLLLAHDALYRKAMLAAPAPPPLALSPPLPPPAAAAVMSPLPPLPPLPPPPLPTAAMLPPLTPASFSVRDFLASLYAADYAGYVAVIDDGVLDARLNFTHFAVTEELLTPGVLPALLRDLLRCRAALQLSFLQPVVDVLLPAFCGSDDEPLDPDTCIANWLQIKNQQTATSPSSILNLEVRHCFHRPLQARQ
jgi:pimeloyl-ACP methyl ester carboxylesterase